MQMHTEAQSCKSPLYDSTLAEANFWHADMGLHDSANIL